MLIVDLFEFIQVHDDQGHRKFMALRFTEFLRGGFKQVVAVMQTGELVRHGQVLKFLLLVLHLLGLLLMQLWMALWR